MSSATSRDERAIPWFSSFAGPIAKCRSAVGEAVVQTGHIIQGTGRFLKRLVGGREDRCQLGGPIKIADMAGRAAKEGMDLLIQLIAFLSVGIGILNLLPIPPLDGGHLAFYAIEEVIRQIFAR